MLITVALIVVVILTLVVKNTIKPAKFPPGPPRLPLFGSLPFMLNTKTRSLFAATRKMLETYGPICGFYLGKERTVLLSDYEEIKQVLKSDGAYNRPDIHPFNDARPGGRVGNQNIGIVASQGASWTEQRRFVSRNLRDFGFGKTSMEPMLMGEIEKLIEKLKQNEGKRCSIKYSFNLSIVNALWTIISGQSLDLDDPMLLNIVSLVSKLISDSSPKNPVALLLPFPSMAKWPLIRDVTGYSFALKVFKEMENLIDGPLKEHLDNFNPDQESDLIDVLIKKVKSNTDKNSRFYGDLGILTIKNILIDMFAAGSETTSSSLVWTFLYMLHHPDVQAKVHEEIDRVVGRDRMVTLDDRSSLHYTNAVLEESFRSTGLVPLNIPHETTTTIKVGDYVIPPKTTVLANLHHIMNDPNYWKDPEVFRPERFLDNEGVFHHDERVVPFSVGKRFCLGQSLAEKEYFLFFVGIIQAFRLKNPPDQVLPSYHIDDSAVNGLTRSPPNFEVILESR